MKLFYFDTADENQIRTIWDTIKSEFRYSDVKGITTNPNALSKIRVTDLDGLKTTIPKLCELVTEMRSGVSGGEVHVQMPQSKMVMYEFMKWAKFVVKLSDGVTRVVLKISPFLSSLYGVYELRDVIRINVTGIADCSTALRALSFKGVNYVSIISGRMDEVGINSSDHIKFVIGSHRVNKRQKVITGSMRTLDGLHTSIKLGTIPTIGSRVWDLILDNDESIEYFVRMWEPYYDPNEFYYSPLIDQRSAKLSDQFFDQMDSLGKDMYGEFSRSLRIRSVLDEDR